MSVELDNKFASFNRWNEQNSKSEKDVNNELKFIHAREDKMIELVEIMQKDLRAYEGRSRLLI